MHCAQMQVCIFELEREIVAISISWREFVCWILIKLSDMNIDNHPLVLSLKLFKSFWELKSDSSFSYELYSFLLHECIYKTKSWRKLECEIIAIKISWSEFVCNIIKVSPVGKSSVRL